MNKITYLTKLLTFCLLLTAYTNVNAQELSCDDLAGLSDMTVEVRDALVELGTINEGDEVDTALGDLIDGLLDVAEYEGNATLEDQVNSMADGWENMDGNQLMQGLNGAINSLDTLLSNDC